MLYSNNVPRIPQDNNDYIFVVKDNREVHKSYHVTSVDICCILGVVIIFEISNGMNLVFN